MVLWLIEGILLYKRNPGSHCQFSSSKRGRPKLKRLEQQKKRIPTCGSFRSYLSFASPGGRSLYVVAVPALPSFRLRLEAITQHTSGATTIKSRKGTSLLVCSRISLQVPQLEKAQHFQLGDLKVREASRKVVRSSRTLFIRDGQEFSLNCCHITNVVKKGNLISKTFLSQQWALLRRES